MNSRKVKLHKTVFDTFVFSLILVLTSGLFVGLRNAFKTNEPLYFYAFVQNILIDKQPLTVDKTYAYDEEVFNAPIEVEVKGGKVRVEKEESPLNYCSLKGFTSEVGNPVLCLPNSFYFVIMGDSYKDAPPPYYPGITNE